MSVSFSGVHKSASLPSSRHAICRIDGAAALSARQNRDRVMFEFLSLAAALAVLLVVLWVRRLHNRVHHLESKVQLLSRVVADKSASAEASVVPAPSLAPEPATPTSKAVAPAATEAAPVLAEVVPEASQRGVEQFRPVPRTAKPKARPFSAKLTAPKRTVAGAATPSRVSKLRRYFGESEWEAVIGGNWLNKVGVLLILIGLAIFLGYSLTQLGPLGRVLTGFAVSTAMLVGGMTLYSRPGYRVFAQGLIGGGWSGVYFTAYAMHALEAARVVADPVLATVLLCIVPIAMLVHACWRRSPKGTTLAFLSGTLTITLSPPFLYAALALLPMLVGVLLIAFRFEWERIALAAVIGIYAAFIWKFSAGALATWPVAGPLLLFSYWLLFELFDIVVVSHRRPGYGANRALFPLNTCGLLAALHLTWPVAAGVSFQLAYGAAAGLYLLSALVRSMVRPVVGDREEADPWWHGVMGGYEFAATASAAFAAAALAERFTGLALTAAFFFEFELIFLLGLTLRQKYLRTLASVCFLPLVGRLLMVHYLMDLSGAFEVVGITLFQVTPLALTVSVAAYLNRAAIRLNLKDPWRALEVFYGFAASTLLVAVLWTEVPLRLVGPSVLLVAFILTQVGLWRRLWDFRAQACAAGLVGLGCTTAVNGLLAVVPQELVASSASYWMWLATAASLFGVVAAQVLRWDFELSSKERQALQHVTLSAGLTLLSLFVWHAFPVPVVATVWAAVALCLYEAGYRLQLPILRAYASVLAAVAFGRLFLANFVNPGMTYGISHRVLVVLPIMLLFYFLAGRAFSAAKQVTAQPWESGWSRACLYLGTLLGVLLIRFEFGRVLAVAGWTAYMLVLYSVGLLRQNADLRWQSYFLALLTLSRCWATNFFIPESLAGAFGRVATGTLTAVGFFAARMLAHFLGRGQPSQVVHRKASLTYVDMHAPSFFSILGSFLVALLIFYEVSGGLLTVAWGAEAALLLLAGLLLRDQGLRVFSLSLFSICIMKVFIYDLGVLSTPYRILSFVLLGILLVAVSWFYTRFRGRVATPLDH